MKIFSLVFKKNNKNYTDKSEIINEYIPQDEIKNLIQEDLPFIKNENKKDENKIKFKLPNLELLKLPTKKERENSNKNETHDPIFLEKILMDQAFITNGSFTDIHIIKSTPLFL